MLRRQHEKQTKPWGGLSGTFPNPRVAQASVQCSQRSDDRQKKKPVRRMVIETGRAVRSVLVSRPDSPVIARGWSMRALAVEFQKRICSQSLDPTPAEIA